MCYTKIVGNNICISRYLTASANNKYSIYRLSTIKLNNLVCNILGHHIYNISCCFSYFKCINLLCDSHDILKCYKSLFLRTCRHFNLFSRIKINKISLCNTFCYFITRAWYHAISNYTAILCKTYIRSTCSYINKTNIKKSVLFRNCNIHSCDRL